MLPTRGELRVLLIGMGLGLVPVVLALIPFTILYITFEGTWYSLDPVGNLRWIVVFGLLYISVVKALSLLATHIRSKYSHSL